MRTALLLLLAATACHAQTNPPLTNPAVAGLPSKFYYGTGVPTASTCTTVSLGLMYVQTDANNGKMWLCDMASGSASWDHLVSPVVGTTATMGGGVITLTSPAEATIAVPGATKGAVCRMARVDGTLNSPGVFSECSVPSDGSVYARISTTLASVTPSASTYNLRILP